MAKAPRSWQSQTLLVFLSPLAGAFLAFIIGKGVVKPIAAAVEEQSVATKDISGNIAQAAQGDRPGWFSADSSLF